MKGAEKSFRMMDSRLPTPSRRDRGKTLLQYQPTPTGRNLSHTHKDVLKGVLYLEVGSWAEEN
jgi:hypothetical protein